MMEQLFNFSFLDKASTFSIPDIVIALFIISDEAVWR